MTSIRETAENFNTDENFKGSILQNEPMSKHTTFRIGGPAPLFLIPKDSLSLVHCLEILKKNSIIFFVLGGGSNLLVSDQGIDGAVVSMSGLHSIEIEKISDNSDVYVKCGSGTPMAALVKFCSDNCISGVEKFSGLPGTVGGALYMNARCFDVSVSDILSSATFLAPETFIKKEYEFSAEDWAYKKSPFQNTGRIICSAVFKLQQKDKNLQHEIQAEAAKYAAERVSKGHFRYPSAGSVFRNNHDFGSPSGKIIDTVGLKGFRIGDAQIAPWHGNFIINLGHATASDVFALIKKVQETVMQKTGFNLEPEIICCGKVNN